jgi:hypothetical protein
VLDAVGVLVVEPLVLVLEVPVVPLVTVEACEAVPPWPARMATAPVPTPVAASSPMVAIATRRLPSSRVLMQAASARSLWTSCGLAERFLGEWRGYIAFTQGVTDGRGCPQITHR